MAAVLDYLCEEILDMAAEHCQKANKVMCEAMIASGGVVPFVHSALYPAKKGAKGAA